MDPFDIILIPFPLSDLSATKKRPCVVLSSYSPRSFGEHLIVAMITSKIDTLKFPHDVTIKEYKKAGLPLPSLIRLSKIVSVEKRIIIKKLGRITDTDQRILKNEFKKLFKNCLE